MRVIGPASLTPSATPHINLVKAVASHFNTPKPTLYATTATNGLYASFQATVSGHNYSISLNLRTTHAPHRLHSVTIATPHDEGGDFIADISLPTINPDTLATIIHATITNHQAAAA